MSDYIMHFGIKGQKWGVRRFENEDGSLTEAGKKRYQYDKAREGLREARRFKKSDFKLTGGHNRRLRIATARANAINKKADLIRETKGDKKADRYLINQMYKHGGAKGSVSDLINGNITSKTLKQLSKTNGKQKAEEIEKKLQNKAVASLIGTTALTVGAKVALYYLGNGGAEKIGSAIQNRRNRRNPLNDGTRGWRELPTYMLENKT